MERTKETQNEEFEFPFGLGVEAAKDALKLASYFEQLQREIGQKLLVPKYGSKMAVTIAFTAGAVLAARNIFMMGMGGQETVWYNIFEEAVKKLLPVISTFVEQKEQPAPANQT